MTKGRILEPVRTLGYSARKYKKGEIDEFIRLDRKLTKKTKKEKLI